MESPRLRWHLLIGTHPDPPPLLRAHVSPAGAPLSRPTYLNSHPPPGGERAGATSGSARRNATRAISAFQVVVALQERSRVRE
jgi:hypothetical protein